MRPEISRAGIVLAHQVARTIADLRVATFASDITIEIRDLPSHTNAEYDTELDVIVLSDKLINRTIGRSFSFFARGLIQVISHELVHAEQAWRGDLSTEICDDQWVVTWRSTEYLIDPDNEIKWREYVKLPWEAEAFAREREICQRAVEHNPDLIDSSYINRLVRQNAN